MQVPVLVEPIATGFRASTGAPLNLVAEAPTADEALAAVRGAMAAKEASGAKVVTVDTGISNHLRELVKDMAANPFFDDWVAATKEYRRQREAEEDAAELAAEKAKLNGAAPSGLPTQQVEPAA